MATDPIKLRHRDHIKYAQSNLQPAGAARPGTFMSAVIPPALALGATGILIGALFDRKHGLFAGTSAALGILGAAIGAGWGALRATGTDYTKIIEQGVKRLFGDQPDESWLAWLNRHRAWTRWLAPTLGLSVGAKGGTGFVNWVYKSLYYPNKLREFGLSLPTKPTDVTRFQNFVGRLKYVLDTRLDTINDALNELKASRLSLTSQGRILSTLLNSRIVTTKMEDMLDLASDAVSQGARVFRGQAQSPSRGGRVRALSFVTPVLPDTVKDSVQKAFSANMNARLALATNEVLKNIEENQISLLTQPGVRRTPSTAPVLQVIDEAAKQHGLRRDQLLASVREHLRTVQPTGTTQAGSVLAEAQRAAEGAAQSATTKARKALSAATEALDGHANALRREVATLREAKQRIPNIGAMPKWRSFAGGGVGAIAGGLAFEQLGRGIERLFGLDYDDWAPH